MVCYDLKAILFQRCYFQIFAPCRHFQITTRAQLSLPVPVFKAAEWFPDLSKNSCLSLPTEACVMARTRLRLHRHGGTESSPCARLSPPNLWTCFLPLASPRTPILTDACNEGHANPARASAASVPWSLGGAGREGMSERSGLVCGSHAKSVSCVQCRGVGLQGCFAGREIIKKSPIPPPSASQFAAAA